MKRILMCLHILQLDILICFYHLPSYLPPHDFDFVNTYPPPSPSNDQQHALTCP